MITKAILTLLLFIVLAVPAEADDLTDLKSAKLIKCVFNQGIYWFRLPNSVDPWELRNSDNSIKSIIFDRIDHDSKRAEVYGYEKTTAIILEGDNGLTFLERQELFDQYTITSIWPVTDESKGYFFAVRSSHGYLMYGPLPVQECGICQIEK